MKVATAVFNNVIAPRTDIANEMIIYKFSKEKLVAREVSSINDDDPFHFYTVAKLNKVQKIVIGSCPHNILNLLLSIGAEVYVNAMGDPDIIVTGILSGETELIPMSKEAIALKKQIKL